MTRFNNKIVAVTATTVAAATIIFLVFMMKKRKRQSLRHLPTTSEKDILSNDWSTMSKFGFRVRLPKGWHFEEIEPGSIGAQTAKINFVADQSMNESFPSSLAIIVEDVEAENLSLLEYSERVSQVAAPQGSMSKMLNLPQIIANEPCAVGPFAHTLEYTQKLSQVQVKYLNFIAVCDGVAYIFQYLAEAAQFEKNVHIALAMARSFEIEGFKCRKPSYVEHCNAAHSVSLRAPPTWTLTSSSSSSSSGAPSSASSSSPSLPIATFLATSLARSEIVSFLRLQPQSPLPSPLAAAKWFLSACNWSKTKTASVTSNRAIARVSPLITKDGKNIKNSVRLCCVTEAYAITVAAAPKNMVGYSAFNNNNSNNNNSDNAENGEDLIGGVTERSVISVLSTVKPHAGLSNTFTRYVNQNCRFSFNIQSKGKLTEHRWSDVAVTYVPFCEENSPVFTVAVNEEAEPCADLMALDKKITSEFDPTSPLLNKKIQRWGNRDFLTFQAIRCDPPFDEYISQVLISLRGNDSLLLRWEVLSDRWDQYSPLLYDILSSFEA